MQIENGHDDLKMRYQVCLQQSLAKPYSCGGDICLGLGSRPATAESRSALRLLRIECAARRQWSMSEISELYALGLQHCSLSLEMERRTNDRILPSLQKMNTSCCHRRRQTVVCSCIEWGCTF